MNEFPLFCWHLCWEPWRRALWFRVRGWGLHICNRKRTDAMFSERYGYRRALYVFGVRFEVLWP
jgi:hypothetical protein